MPDIRLFDRAGALLVTAENCPEDLRERFPVLKRAYDATVAADAAYESGKDRIASYAQQVAAGEQFIRVHFPNRGDAGRIADLKAMIASNRRT